MGFECAFQTSALILILVGDLTWAAIPRLLTIRDEIDTSALAPCKAAKIASCERVYVNMRAIGSDSLEFPGGVVMTQSKRLPASLRGPRTYHYKGGDAGEAVLTVGRTLTAAITLADEDRTLTVESCSGEDCYVLIEESYEQKHPPVDPISTGTDLLGAFPEVSNDYPNDFGYLSNETTTTLSVMFYYSPEFAAVTDDIEGYIRSLVTYANYAYLNSDIPVELEVFCIQEYVGFVETEDPNRMLAQFTLHRGSPRRTKNSADIAFLVLSQPRGACGVARMNGFRSGLTFGWVAKNCLPQIVVAHEVGHMFGVQHNREISRTGPLSSLDGSYEFGNLIDGGYVSIMAYSSKETNHTTRIMMFSSPDLVFDGAATGTPESDARRAHLERRGRMADIGDETGSCPAQCEDVRASILCRIHQLCCGNPACSRICLKSCGMCG